MAPKIPPRMYQVFISHAGEDKATIAIPLREMLGRKGITAFVDDEDIRLGSFAMNEITSAMDNANVAVIVLSPEFVAKKWPIKELLFFLLQQDKAQGKGETLPVIIPVFYRLSVADMYTEPDPWRKTADGRSLYRITRFFERRNNGEPEANENIIREALRALHGIIGVENKYHASNDTSSMPARQLLLKDTCEMIASALVEHNTTATQNEQTVNTFQEVDQFRRYFYTEPLRNVVLDFDTLDGNDEPLRQEGRIKHRILNGNRDTEQVIAILGIGGVGKSTILKALATDGDLRERFFDGIHVVSLGMDATNRTLVQEFSRALNDSGAEKASAKLKYESRLDVAVRELKHETLPWFDGKSCLFLIDDVWTTKLGVELFSQVVKLGSVGQQNTVVFTTRESKIASLAPSRESIFRVNPRESQSKISRDTLLHHAGMKESNIREGCSAYSIEEILKICAGLPVTLAAAGKTVKMTAIDMETHDVWTEYLSTLRNYREQLLREDVGDYGNLYITFGASVSLLEGRDVEKLGFKARVSFAEMHRRLCVLVKQDKVPASMLRYLWELRNDEEAERVGKLFVEVGLAESSYRVENANYAWQLCIHYSIHDYSIAEAKRHGGLVRAHKILVNGYGQSHPDLRSTEDGQTNWLSEHFKNDGYIHQNLCRHLEESGREKDLDKLCDELFL